MTAEVRFEVWLSPKASRNEIVGWEGEALRVRVTAPPSEGKANEALVRLLAERLGASPSSVRIVGGWTSRRKLVLVEGLGAHELRSILMP